MRDRTKNGSLLLIVLLVLNLLLGCATKPIPVTVPSAPPAIETPSATTPPAAPATDTLPKPNPPATPVVESPATPETSTPNETQTVPVTTPQAPSPSPAPVTTAPSSIPQAVPANLPLPDPQLAQHMVELINKDRTSAGLTSVTLGNNSASQIHAEEMLANSYIAHWGLDGLKPYMRYTVAGGLNYESENLFTTTTTGGSPSSSRDTKTMLDEAEQGLMDSPGHRATILNKWHKKVNLGIAYKDGNLALVQQFEGDYLEFVRLPVIENGILSSSGGTSEGLVIDQVQIWYDQLPHSLTVGQLGKTFGYWRGSPAAFIRPPPPPGSYYTDSEVLYSWDTAVDPYSVPANTPPPDPSSPEQRPPPVVASEWVQAIDAAIWNVSESSFGIEADLTGILAKFGSGVYTVILWGESNGESFAISNYSLFVE